MKSPLFRKAALEHLQSPEQLDRPIPMVSAKTWVFLVGVTVLFVVVALWSVFGRVPITVEAEGVLIRHGGVIDIQAPQEGFVGDIFVDVGQMIFRRQKIAQIQPLDIARKASELGEEQDRLIRRQKALVLVDSFGAVPTENIDQILVERLHAVELRIERLNHRLHHIETISSTNASRLLNELTEEKIALVDQKLVLKSAIHLLTLRPNVLENQGWERADMARRLEALHLPLQHYQDELANSGVLHSFLTGQIVEVKVKHGQLVHAGDPIVSVENLRLAHSGLQAIVFVPAEMGDQLSEGMPVFVSPSGYKKESYGMILAKVLYVSKYPATLAAMKLYIDNDQLIQRVSQSGPVIEVLVQLNTDDKSPSGFAWTSSRGPNAIIKSGNLCEAHVVTSEIRPIELVLPYLKRLTQ
ncbi:MAG: NHLP bacteriocin system secretion protein [Candidatus Margulisiibacteriota bacterium]